MKHNQQNLLIYLVCFVLLAGNTGCLAYQPAIPISNPAPIIAAGELVGLQPGTTYHFLNQVMKAGGEIWVTKNLTHFLVRWPIPDRPGVDGMTLINITETSKAYWKELRGFLVNREDAKVIVDTAKGLGWGTMTVKEVGITKLAQKIAAGAAAVSTSGEILFSGIVIFIEDWIKLVSDSEGL